MSVPSSSPQVYRWIKASLTQALLQIKASLSEADASSHAEAMHRISNRFHHIQGLLKMIELNAASLLAHDMELLSGEIADNCLTMDFDEAVIPLRNGLGKLQSYQSSVENQSPLSPLALVDEMNAIRRISGRDPVSRYDLFEPPLDFDPKFPSEDMPELSSEDRSKLLANLRKRYRKALLSRLNHPEREDSLTTMVQIMDYMQRVSSLDIYQRLWWVAAGFMESLKGCGFDLISGTNVLFARLDNEMSRIKDGPADVDSTPTNELLRQMLYFIGSTDAGQCYSERTSHIKTALGLNHWFSQETGFSEQDQFELLSDSIVEFTKKIEADFFPGFESQLGLYLSGVLDEEQIKAFYTDLDTMDRLSRENNLGRVGRLIGALRNIIQNANRDPAHLVQTGEDIRITSSVSLLKEALNDPGMVTAHWLASVAECESELCKLTVQDEIEDEEMCSRQLNSTEYSQARSTLLDDIEAMFTDTSTDGKDQYDLRLVEEHLNKMMLWFRVVKEDQMAQLSENTARVLSCFRAEGIGLGREKKEKIAFVVASIGIRSEPLEMIRFRTGTIIEQAQKMLDSLTMSVDRLDSDPEIPISANEEMAELDGESEDEFLEESEALLTRVKAQLMQWRTNGISAEILRNISSEFQTFKSRASVAGYDEIVRLGYAVENLLEASSGENSEASGSSLLNLMEEIHDGLASDLGFMPGATRDHIKTLTKIVELLLPDSVIDREEVQGSSHGNVLEDSGMSELASDPVASGEVWDDGVSGDIKTVFQPLAGPPLISPGEQTNELVDSEKKILDKNLPRMDNRGISDILNYVEEFGLGRTRLKTALDEARQELASLRSITKSIRDRLIDLGFDVDTPRGGIPKSSRQRPGDDTSSPVQRDQHLKMQARIQEMSQQLERMSRVERQLFDRAWDLEDILARQSHLVEKLQDDFKSVQIVSISE